MSRDFVHLPGLGIYRKDTIKKVVPLQKTDYRIEVHPPVNTEDDFVFRFVKSTEIVAAVFFDGDDEETVDEDTKTAVEASVEFTRDEIIAELYAGDDDNKEIKSIKDKTKNYKIRLKKIAAYEEQMRTLDAAKGSPTYDSLVQALSDSAPTNEGQVERVTKVEELLNERLASITPGEDEDSLELFELLNTDASADQVKAAARVVLEHFNDRLNGDEEAFNFISDDDPNLSEDLENDLDRRLTETSPEAARERAFSILGSKDAITNSNFGTDSQNEPDLDEDETNETDVIEVKPN